MDGLTAAFYQRLTGDSTLASLLSEYPAGSGVPAVFTAARVRSDAVLPYISTTGVLSDEAWDTKDVRGRFINRDIYVYFPVTQTADLEEASERVRTLFHRHRLEVPGWQTVVSRCAVRVNNTDDYAARIVTVTLRMLEDDDESS
jgi:hypothetical protein